MFGRAEFAPIALRDAETFTCQPPVNADPHLDFPERLQLTHPASVVLTLTDVTVKASGYLYRRGRLLPSAFGGESLSWVPKSHLARAWIGTMLKPSARRDEALWITDNWSRNYFHWFTESIPRLVFARRAGVDVRDGLLLPAPLRDAAYVSRSLERLGVAHEFMRPGAQIRVRRLIFPQHLWHSGRCATTALREVQSVLLDGLEAGEPRRERIYLRRKPPVCRTVLNEDEVVRELEKHGFTALAAEDLSWEEQVRTFMGCRVLVAPHGAGETNMLFMPSGGSVLEFLPRVRTGWRNSCYCYLASSLGHRYLMQPARTQTPSSAADTGGDAHMTIDVELLRQNLALLLS